MTKKTNNAAAADPSENRNRWKIKVPAAFPEEFISTLADECTRVLHDWLAGNGAPKEVVDAVYDIDYLRHYEIMIWRDKIVEPENKSVKESVAGAATAIALLGGKFSGGGSESWPRKPIEWRQPPAETAEPKGEIRELSTSELDAKLRKFLTTATSDDLMAVADNFEGREDSGAMKQFVKLMRELALKRAAAPKDAAQPITDEPTQILKGRYKGTYGFAVEEGGQRVEFAIVTTRDAATGEPGAELVKLEESYYEDAASQAQPAAD